MLSFHKKKKNIEVKAPMNGCITSIEDVEDPVFSQKMMGDGIAIQYSGGDVCAPIAGVISAVVLPSMHAFGIRSEEGVELLVHVGLETVNLKGEGFTILKQQGDHVEAGEKILSVDFDLLKEKGINLITPVILTNSDAFAVETKAPSKCIAMQNETTIFTLKKK